jgi:hypothetical protein
VHALVTRERRLGEFNAGPPSPDQPFELLCEDHNGTYVLPYVCQWRDGAWRNGETGVAIESRVVGWRA